jgi:hypothetical protein
MMDDCAQQGCTKLVDIDAWAAYPDEYAGIPHLCNEHMRPHEATITERFRVRREKDRSCKKP